MPTSSPRDPDATTLARSQAPAGCASRSASAASREEVSRIVQHIRARWPEVRILLRADSGFRRDDLMSWCETNQVHYVFGLARNQRLRASTRLIENRIGQSIW